MQGDPIIAFLSDIIHLAIDEYVIHRNYILVGIVKSFVDVEWNIRSDFDIVPQERLKVCWCDIDDWDSYKQVKTPDYRNVKVI